MAPSSVKSDRPLRVLQVVHDYYPAVGGSELQFRQIAEGLAARGVEVSVFTSTARSTGDFVKPNAETFPAGTENINGVQVRRFPFRQFSPPIRRGLSKFSQLWSSRRWPGYGELKTIWVGPHLPGLVRHAVRWAPDIITATAAPFMPIYRAAKAARRANRPVALMPCLHPGDRWLMDNPALLRLLRRADGIMALTHYEMRLLQALGVDAGRLWLIGNGIAAGAAQCAARGLRARFKIPEAEPVVLFCSRKEEGKGIQDVLEAMVRLWQQNKSGALVLAGASTEFSRTWLARLIDRLPPEWKTRVLIRDDIEEAEKWGWYSECDVFALPSHIDSFGLVYLEAWLCGKPVIGGRTGAQCSVIEEGRDGLLVRLGDVDELAAAIGRVLSEPGLGPALGRAGRAKVLSRYTWDSVVDRAEEMYRRLAAQYRHASHQRDRRHLQ
jgi:glycosyltransferase involved in cell wall biosynthesis